MNDFPEPNPARQGYVYFVKNGSGPRWAERQRALGRIGAKYLGGAFWAVHLVINTDTDTPENHIAGMDAYGDYKLNRDCTDLEFQMVPTLLNKLPQMYRDQIRNYEATKKSRLRKRA